MLNSNKNVSSSGILSKSAILLLTFKTEHTGNAAARAAARQAMKFKRLYKKHSKKGRTVMKNVTPNIKRASNRLQS